MKKYSRRLSALLIGLNLCVLTGCATPYTNVNGILGMFGGYANKDGPGKLISVYFTGNSLISVDRARRHLIYRCAELAQEKGKEYFTIYASVPNAIDNVPFAIPDSLSTTQISNEKPNLTMYLLLQDTKFSGSLSTKEALEAFRPQ